jgi:hypothetical protein
VVRPLPLGVVPADEETLESYLDRLAYRYRSSRRDVLRATGLSQPTGRTSYPLGLAVELDDALLSNFCRATGLGPEQVRAMQLISLHGRVADFSSAEVPVYQRGNRLRLREWFFLYGSHACPGCLDDRDGAWRLRWKLPWSFGCVTHERMLLAACPACERPLVPERTGKNPPYIAHPVTPGCCTDRPRVITAKGRAGVPCGYRLGDATTRPLVQRLKLAQAALDASHVDGVAAIAGAPVSCMEYFSHARSLTALLLRFAQTSDLGELPAWLQDAFERFAAQRDAALAVKQAARDRGPNARFYTATPRSPQLMAAVAPLVTEALAAQSTAELADRLGHLQQRLRAGRITVGAASTIDRFSLAPVLADAIDSVDAGRHLWRRHGRPRSARAAAPGDGVERTVGDALVHRANVAPECGFEVRHAPQLIWREAWQVLFSELLPTQQQMPARTFLSMLLVKVRYPGSWQETADRLEMHYFDSAERANGFVYRAGKAGIREELRARIDLLADVLDELPVKVDYQARRQRFAAFAGLDDIAWENIARATGIHPGKGTRRTNSDIWVWAELTGGPLYQAPAATAADAGYRVTGRRLRRSGRPKNFWANYSRFYVHELPGLRDALSEYAATLIPGEALRPISEQVLREQLAKGENCARTTGAGVGAGGDESRGSRHALTSRLSGAR